MKAELLDLRGDTDGALSKYKAAIASASERGAISEQAIAEQRVGEFHLRRNRFEDGRIHLLRSIDLFEEWGAHGKSTQLREKHGDALTV